MVANVAKPQNWEKNKTKQNKTTFSLIIHFDVLG
jgi:hypothetical protein